MHTITSPSGTTAQPQRARRKEGLRFWVGRVLLRFVLTLVTLAAMGASYQAIATAIDQLLTDAFKPSEPGAAVIVVRDGQVILRKGYGMANLELGVPIAPEMVFRRGSITKQFTAVAILMLMEEGRVSLSDDITRFLPDFPTHGQTITIEQLIALSVMITWLYISSGGNILLTSLFHAAQSFFVIINQGIPLEQQAWLMASVYVVAALIIAIVARPRCASAIAHQGAQRDNLHVGMKGGL